MKNTLFFFMILCTGIFLPGCTKNGAGENNLVFINNMEASFAWSEMPQRNLVYSPIARSGKYVCIIDSGNVFSITYNMKMSDVDPDPLKRVTVGAWFNVQQDGSDPNLAIDVKDSIGNTIDWISQNDKNLAKRTGNWEWMEMTIDLTVKKRNASGNTIRIYAFNKKGAACLVDDFEVRYEK
jgi:hypothetical protein